MRKLFLLALALLAGCASVKPPSECSGPVRKVNPETVLASVECKVGTA
jgi:hypothetical protein